jgi:hypothetical protein
MLNQKPKGRSYDRALEAVLTKQIAASRASGFRRNRLNYLL